MLADVTDDMKVFAEENFGPIAAITRFRDEDEVLARANATDMGLCGLCLHAQPGARPPHGRRRSRPAWSASTASPWRPPRRHSAEPSYSGMGREGGSEGIADYLDTKLAQIVF